MVIKILEIQKQKEFELVEELIKRVTDQVIKREDEYFKKALGFNVKLKENLDFLSMKNYHFILFTLKYIEMIVILESLVIIDFNLLLLIKEIE